MTLGDGACLIHAHEEKRQSLGIWPLQGGQPVGHLLDRGSKTLGHKFQVVARFARSIQKGIVGQQCGTGEIIGQPDLGDVSRFGAVKTGQIQCGIKKL